MPRSMRKLTAAEKRAVIDYALPHTDYQTAAKFRISVTVVRMMTQAAKPALPQPKKTNAGHFRKPRKYYL